MKKIIYLLILFLAQNCFAQATQPQKLTVMLDYRVSITHAPLVIAQQLGYFKNNGLNVELIAPKQDQDATQLVADKKADIGLTYEPWFIENVDQGVPVIRIGTLIDKPLNCVIALKRSGIKSLNDLKGKEIGTSSNRLTSTVLNAMLKHQGIATTDIKISGQQDLTAALLAHKVDAISGMMRNLEVPMLETSGHKVVVFFPEEHGIPNYSELVFITNTRNVKDPRFPRFLAAIKQAIRYMDEHPDAAWRQFTQEHPHLNTRLNREFWFSTLPYYAENPSDFDRNDWQKFADFMKTNKLISKAMPINRYAVNIG